MNRRIIIGLASLFSLFFLFYVFQLASEISTSEERINKSSDVLDVTDLIHSKYVISESTEMPGTGWRDIKLPESIQADPKFKEGNFAYYSITVPRNILEKLPHLRGQLAISLGLINFSRYDIIVNGKFFRTNTPVNTNEGMTVIPLEDGVDNSVVIMGTIAEGNVGLEHRLRILVGKQAKLNELFLLSYKGVVVFPQIFILSKGSVLFLFTLIFIVISVSPFFEKFLIYGLCTLSADFLTSDALMGILTLNQMTMLFSLLNIGAVIALFLFLTDATKKTFQPGRLKISAAVLVLASVFITIDVLYTHLAVDFTVFLRFWNIVPALVLTLMLPLALKSSRVLALGMFISVAMTFISATFNYSVLFNYRVFGDLILFFAVAAETFFLLRKEQDQLREQEKDVAIGKTAAILAHDVRRPLEQMRMVLDRISAGKSTPEFLESARRDVEFSLTSVNTQVNDIMNFSSVRTLELTPVSFHRLLSSSITQVMTINQNVDLKLSYDFQGTNKILGDESLLSGVLTNLISNSVEAIRDIGKKSSGSIHFATKMEGSKFIFSITNNGPEIPEEHLTDIWKPLFTRGKNKGTGLGLASVARAIHDHQGSVIAANTPDGVRFTIILQTANESDETTKGNFPASSKDFGYSKTPVNSMKKKGRVLVLDDDSQVFDYFQFLSSEVDFTFVSTYSEAEKEVNSKRFDLYIIDYDLGTPRTGADFIEQYLPMNKHVVLHTNRESTLKHKGCVQIAKPMSAGTFSRLVDESLAASGKILLVDDSELVREAWTMYHGEHNLTAVNSPEEAMELKETYSSYVLDYYFDNSPMNGLELARDLRMKHGNSLIVISSNVNVPTKEFPVIAKNQFSLVQRSS